MKVFPFLSPLWILNVKILWSSAESWEPVTQSDSRSFPHPAGKIFQWFVCCPSLCCDWNAAWWLLFSSPSFLLNPPGTFWLTDRPHCLAVKVSGECYCYHRTLLVITRTQSRDMAGYYVSFYISDPSDYNLTTNSIWPVGIRIKQTEDIWTIWNP